MFCPSCGAEFRDGFIECSDCGVALVKDRPPEDEPEYVDYVEVLSTQNHADLAVIESILDAEGITYFLHGELSSHNIMNVLPVKVMVSAEDAESAVEALKDLDLSVLPATPFDENEGDEEEDA